MSLNAIATPAEDILRQWPASDRGSLWAEGAGGSRESGEPFRSLNRTYIEKVTRGRTAPSATMRVDRRATTTHCGGSPK
jgi:hypothetical protein